MKIIPTCFELFTSYDWRVMAPKLSQACFAFWFISFLAFHAIIVWACILRILRLDTESITERWWAPSLASCACEPEVSLYTWPLPCCEHVLPHPFEIMPRWSIRTKVNSIALVLLSVVLSNGSNVYNSVSLCVPFYFKLILSHFCTTVHYYLAR